MLLRSRFNNFYNTNEFSASRYLDEIKTDKFNSKDKLRDPTLIAEIDAVKETIFI